MNEGKNVRAGSGRKMPTFLLRPKEARTGQGDALCLSRIPAIVQQWTQTSFRGGGWGEPNKRPPHSGQMENRLQKQALVQRARRAPRGASGQRQGETRTPKVNPACWSPPPPPRTVRSAAAASPCTDHRGSSIADPTGSDFPPNRKLAQARLAQTRPGRGLTSPGTELLCPAAP